MSEYNKIIKSIKTKTRILLVLYLLIEVFLFIVLPSIVYFVIVSLLALCVYLFSLSKVNAPIFEALDKECDPIKFKHLFFSDANKKSGGVSALSANFNIYFLTGKLDEAIGYAEQMISDGRFNAVIAGYSNKAIAEFFKGDYDSMKRSVSNYNQKISEASHVKRNEMTLYQNNATRLNLYVAIAENDDKQIDNLVKQLKVTNNTNLARVQINFLKAMSAQITGNASVFDECCDFVKEFGGKTIYSCKISSYINQNT